MRGRVVALCGRGRAGLTTLMTEPWQFYVLWGVVVGIATGAIAIPLAAIVANRWFVRRRGLVGGLLRRSNASGQLIFLPLLAWLVERLRLARTAAVVVIAAVFVVVARSRSSSCATGRSSSACALRRDRGPPPPAPSAREPVPRRRRRARECASHKRDFWLLAGAFFICGATTNGLIGTHLIAACADHGLTRGAAPACSP